MKIGIKRHLGNHPTIIVGDAEISGQSEIEALAIIALGALPLDRQKIVAMACEAIGEVNRLRASGWTQEQFASALKNELNGGTGHA